MNKVQKFDFLIAVLPNSSPLRDEINRLFHAQEDELFSGIGCVIWFQC